MLCDDWCHEFFFAWSQEISLQSALGLHSLFCRMQSEWQPVQRKPQNIEQDERSQKREQKWPSVVLYSLAHVYEALSPWKNLEGWPICSLHKNSRFLVPANEIRVRSLVSWERNYVYVIMTYHTLSCLTACDTTSLEPVSSPLYPNGSNPILLQ